MSLSYLPSSSLDVPLALLCRFPRFFREILDRPATSSSRKPRADRGPAQEFIGSTGAFVNYRFTSSPLLNPPFSPAPSFHPDFRRFDARLEKYDCATALRDAIFRGKHRPRASGKNQNEEGSANGTPERKRRREAGTDAGIGTSRRSLAVLLVFRSSFPTVENIPRSSTHPDGERWTAYFRSQRETRPASGCSPLSPNEERDPAEGLFGSQRCSTAASDTS